MISQLLHALGLAATAVIVLYVLAYHGTMLAMALAGAREAWRQRAWGLLPLPALGRLKGAVPGVSVIVPCHNEELTILRTLRSLLATRHPDLEVIVVNDGSKDKTLEVIWEEYELELGDRPDRDEVIPAQRVRAVLTSRKEPRLVVIDKRNGGKADALNAGINHATRPLVCVVDADVVLEPDALLLLSLPFLEDESTVATSGAIRPLNGLTLEDGVRPGPRRLPAKPLECLQLVEYARAFTIGRLFFNRRNAHLLISGAFGLFRREELVALRGYQPNAIGEDMELVVRMQRRYREEGRRFRITYVPLACCFTELPTSLRELGGQRTRWQQGLLTTLRLHRGLFFRPRYGAVGMLAHPYYLLFELLSPIVELLGWLSLPVLWLGGWLDGWVLLLIFAATALAGSLTSTVALIVDGMLYGPFSLPGRVALFAFTLLEHLGYHQVVLSFRARAFVRYYRQLHIKGGWSSPQRLGAAAEGDMATAPE